MRDRQRFESLRKLAPREAVQAWLNGQFGIDDEPALIEALRRDPRVIGSDDQIIDTFCNAMVELIPPAKAGGRPRITDMREVVNAVCYVLRA